MTDESSYGSRDHQQELAIRAGLLLRLGPTDREIQDWPRWKQHVVRVLPRSQRWRLSPMAPVVKYYLNRS